MEPKKVLIQINNVSFKYEGSEELFEDLKLTVKQGDKTAIVGANGAGKSTLLKILTGQITPEIGNITINCSPYYVPQIDLTIQQGELKIYEYISQYYEEWWDVLTELEKLFGLSIDTESEAKTLSGGELMKLNLAIAIKHNPDVLILDEPTNHLDVKSINTLIKFINEDSKNKYTFIIVSHDTFFLDQVINTIWELDNRKITAYGGNYTFYKEQKALHLRGLKRQYDIAQEKLEKANELEQKEIERSAKKANEAKRAYMKGSIDRRQLGLGRNAASALQSVKTDLVERLKEEAEEKLEEYETEERRLAFINMTNTKENKGKTIFETKRATVTVNNVDLIKDVDLKVVYGDRIVIAGDNGSGKTSLVKSLIKKVKNSEKYIKAPNVEMTGDVYVGTDLAWVYIDQSYSLVKPNLTLIENLMAYNENITDGKAKEQLGKFQFKSEFEMNKKGDKLSGGETVRLIMAMITSFPIDLIILDEPTNNLDVETVEVLTKSLNNFRGAIIVISHNIEFLHNINIKVAYIVKNHKLKLMDVEPAQKERFYKALVS